MGLLKGSLTYTRCRIVAGPNSHPAETREDLQARAFVELRPQAPEQSSVGWCHFDDPTATDFDDYSNLDRLGVRIDTVALPAATIKALTASACRAKAKQQGREKLSRREIAVVKEEVTRQVRLKTMPRMAHVQMVIDDKDIWIAATGSKADAARELFERTFLCQVREVTASSLAYEAAGDGVAVVEPARWTIAFS